ncbi:MAG: response regulator [Anaerolineae bacterium]
MAGWRILVVDDESPTRDFIVDGLNALNITDEAVGVPSAEDALAAAEEQAPDLVISDIRMTGLNGLDLARVLRQKYPDTKIVLVTGYSTRDIEKTAQALEVDALLRKPFGLDALGEIVRTALQHKQLAPKKKGLYPAQIELLTRQLEVLKRDVGAQWIGLLDKDGHIALTVGSPEAMDRTITQLVNEGWATNVLNIAKSTGPCFTYIEGQPHDIYLASVDSQYALVFLYDRRWQANRVGAVWLTVKHTVQELARVLSNQPQNSLPAARLNTDYSRYALIVEP